MKTIFFLIFLILTPALASASFESSGTGARPAALGAAYSVVANDIYAVRENPAGLVYLKRKEFSATYAILHPGLDDSSKISDTFVAYGHPISPDIGTMGVSFNQTALQGLYRERAVALGYGRRIRQRWAVGGAMKHLYRGFGVPSGRTSNTGVTDPNLSDPAFDDGESKWNIGLDLGVLYRPSYNYSYGFAIENINEPDLSITKGNSDPVPMLIKGGMAYSDGSLTLMSALDSRKGAGGIDRDMRFTMAGEKWWLGSAFANGDLAFRGSLAFGSRDFVRMAMGLSMRLAAMQLDYGFFMPLRGATLGTTQGNHRVTLSLRFGPVIVEPDYEVRMRSAELDMKKAQRAAELAEEEARKMAYELQRFKDESEKLAQQRQTLQAPLDLKILAARFAEAMERYWRKKSDGATIEERLVMLRQIVTNFNNPDLDISVAKNELAALESLKGSAEEDLAVSWNYYRKIAERGASVPERVLLLDAMISRFSKTAADLSEIRRELQSLKGQ